MKNKKYLITLISLFFVFKTIAAIIPDQISLAFSSGNSKELARFFNSSIELVVLDQENIFSSDQAEQIINVFFAKNKPTDFRILHEGGKEGSRYAIGILKTADKTYRVYFLIKSNGEKSYIHQLRIEEENGN